MSNMNDDTLLPSPSTDDMDELPTFPDGGLPILEEFEYPDESTSRLYHVKIPYCPQTNFTAYAKKIFDPEPAKCLVMAENLNKATGHIHMQGYTRRSKKALQKIRQDMHDGHSLNLEHKRKCKESSAYAEKHKRVKLSTEKKDACTERGFQYVCKEVNVPIYSQGFTPEELTQLHENSNAYVAAKKEAVRDIVDRLFDPKHYDPQMIGNRGCEFPTVGGVNFDAQMLRLYNHIRWKVMIARRDAGHRVTSRYFKDDILNAMMNVKGIRREHEQWISMQF
jgi:hypothetical protein